METLKNHKHKNLLKYPSWESFKGHEKNPGLEKQFSKMKTEEVLKKIESTDEHIKIKLKYRECRSNLLNDWPEDHGVLIFDEKKSFVIGRGGPGGVETNATPFNLSLAGCIGMVLQIKTPEGVKNDKPYINIYEYGLTMDKDKSSAAQVFWFNKLCQRPNIANAIKKLKTVQITHDTAPNIKSKEFLGT